MEFWPEVLNKISEKIAPASFETWFKNTLIEVENDLITLYVENEFSRHWVENRYADIVFETVKEITGKSYNIHYIAKSQDSYEHSTDIFYPNKNTKINELLEKIENLEARVAQLEARLSLSTNESQ